MKEFNFLCDVQANISIAWYFTFTSLRLIYNLPELVTHLNFIRINQVFEVLHILHNLTPSPCLHIFCNFCVIFAESFQGFSVLTFLFLSPSYVFPCLFCNLLGLPFLNSFLVQSILSLVGEITFLILNFDLFLSLHWFWWFLWIHEKFLWIENLLHHDVAELTLVLISFLFGPRTLN